MNRPGRLGASKVAHAGAVHLAAQADPRGVEPERIAQEAAVAPHGVVGVVAVRAQVELREGPLADAPAARREHRPRRRAGLDLDQLGRAHASPGPRAGPGRAARRRRRPGRRAAPRAPPPAPGRSRARAAPRPGPGRRRAPRARGRGRRSTSPRHGLGAAARAPTAVAGGLAPQDRVNLGGRRAPSAAAPPARSAGRSSAPARAPSPGTAAPASPPGRQRLAQAQRPAGRAGAPGRASGGVERGEARRQGDSRGRPTAPPGRPAAQRARRRGLLQEAAQLVGHAGAPEIQGRRRGSPAAAGSGVEREAQSRGVAGRAHQPARVLLEPVRSQRAHEPRPGRRRRRAGRPAPPPGPREPQGHRVDGEVAPGEVVGERARRHVWQGARAPHRPRGGPTRGPAGGRAAARCRRSRSGVGSRRGRRAPGRGAAPARGVALDDQVELVAGRPPEQGVAHGAADGADLALEARRDAARQGMRGEQRHGPH